MSEHDTIRLLMFEIYERARRAKRSIPEPMPLGMTAAWLRAVAKTTERRAA